VKVDSINGVLCILISTVKRGSAEISNRVSRKMRLRRATSIAGENSINFELNFQILSDDRGPGPLSSDEIWEFNFTGGGRNSRRAQFTPAYTGVRRSPDA